ncbi:MAG: VapC toxin family PIN domain ribonuclease [SAR86 cluster bacterium]|uniref:VapC toxin family PIN domain ribonuclease n=1 Tax=SAR86 cluster bacterium TaxID=2030880 RepID=A0A2A5B066_9GAMM|nr:MAG: VapC toxin family PIN domain ribonuclease [SAR86 cluster bacterium]
MIVIDTHVLLWWVSGDKSLSAKAGRTIKKCLTDGGEVIVSSITVWEIAMLIEKNRLVLSMDIESWVNEVAQIEGVRFMPVNNEIAMKSAALPGEFHKDPADRIIVATARKLAVSLVTADGKIIDYEHVKTIW